MSRLVWQLISVIIGLVFIYMILRWIGFDMNNFQTLWDTLMNCLGDILHQTKGVFN